MLTGIGCFTFLRIVYQVVPTFQVLINPLDHYHHCKCLSTYPCNWVKVFTSYLSFRQLLQILRVILLLLQQMILLLDLTQLQLELTQLLLHLENILILLEDVRFHHLVNHFLQNILLLQ